LVVNLLFELLKIEKSNLSVSDEINYKVTNSMMSDFIAEQEKTIWMFYSLLDKQ
jgi:starvation-inducible DNA-binding protein